MHVRHLSLADFRSYPALELGLEPGVNVFVGPNGQGKTNLVESVGYIATLGSHRVSSDAPLVRHGAERAVVRALVVSEGRELLAEVEIAPGKANRARVNRAQLPRARDVLGVLRTVIFAPEDLTIAKGDPADRRRFIDELLVNRAPRFAGVRSDYDRVLKQRNALLKSAAAGRRGGRGRRSGSDASPELDGATATVESTLDVWDGHLARAGAALLSGRLALVAALAGRVRDSYHAVAQTEDADAAIEYRCSAAEPDADGAVAALALDASANSELLQDMLLAAMLRVRTQELDRGLSLVGPHRDDLLLSLGGVPVRGYASHGESWSMALSLKLASYELLTAEGAEPVLILDDVFAELDRRRRDRLGDLVRSAEQVLVTAAVAEDVPAALAGGGDGGVPGVRYDVGKGVVERA